MIIPNPSIYDPVQYLLDEKVKKMLRQKEMAKKKAIERNKKKNEHKHPKPYDMYMVR